MKILTDISHEIQQTKVFLERQVQVANVSLDNELVVQQVQPNIERNNELEQLREKAYQNGLKQAEKEIEQAILELECKYADEHAVLKRQLDSSISALNLLAENLIKTTNQARTQAFEQAVVISYAGITRILEAAAIEKSLMADVCRSIVAEYGSKPITIGLNQDDFSLINAELFPVAITISPELKRGQCHVLNTHGYFETGIDIRLEAIKNSFLSALKSSQRTNA